MVEPTWDLIEMNAAAQSEAPCSAKEINTTVDLQSHVAHSYATRDQKDYDKFDLAKLLPLSSRS